MLVAIDFVVVVVVVAVVVVLDRVDLDDRPTIPNVEHRELVRPILEDLPRPLLPRWNSVVLLEL